MTEGCVAFVPEEHELTDFLFLIVCSLDISIRLSSTYCKTLKILLHTIETDVPVKIFGILPQKKERNTLWRLLFALYECSSIYKYGRVELNVFISEKEYKVRVRDFTGSKE